MPVSLERKLTIIGYEWNAISDMLKAVPYRKAHFIHYGGLLGSIIWKTEKFLEPLILSERESVSCSLIISARTWSGTERFL